MLSTPGVNSGLFFEHLLLSCCQMHLVPRSVHHSLLVIWQEVLPKGYNCTDLLVAECSVLSPTQQPGGKYSTSNQYHRQKSNKFVTV